MGVRVRLVRPQFNLEPLGYAAKQKYELCSVLVSVLMCRLSNFSMVKIKSAEVFFLSLLFLLKRRKDEGGQEEVAWEEINRR